MISKVRVYFEESQHTSEKQLFFKKEKNVLKEKDPQSTWRIRNLCESCSRYIKVHPVYR